MVVVRHPVVLENQYWEHNAQCTMYNILLNITEQSIIMQYITVQYSALHYITVYYSTV